MVFGFHIRKWYSWLKPSSSSYCQDCSMFALTQQVGYFLRFLYSLKEVTGILCHDFGPVRKKRWVKYFSRRIEKRQMHKAAAQIMFSYRLNQRLLPNHRYEVTL